MQKLTAKEEEIMGIFWEKGELFVKDILSFYDDPKPHFNTLSTIVRGLEEKGYLSHKSFGSTYLYYSLISAEQYHRGTLRHVVARYFDNSYKRVVSALIDEQSISVEDLKALIKEVENQKKK